MARLVRHGHIGDQTAVAGRQGQRDIRRLIGRLQRHRINRKLRAVRRVGHRVGHPHAHLVRELAQHLNHEDIQPDKAVAAVSFAEGDGDVLHRQQVLHFRQGRVLDGGDLGGDRVDPDFAVGADEVVLHMAVLTAPRHRAVIAEIAVAPLDIGRLLYRMLEPGQAFGEGHAVFGAQERGAVLRGVVEDFLVSLGIALKRLIEARVHIRQVDRVAGAAKLAVGDIGVADRRDSHGVLHGFFAHIVVRPVQLIRPVHPENARRAVHQVGVEPVIVRLPLRLFRRGDVVACGAGDPLAREVAVLVVGIGPIGLLFPLFLLRQRIVEEGVGHLEIVRVEAGVRVLMRVDHQLPLSHRTVAGKAGRAEV